MFGAKGQGPDEFIHSTSIYHYGDGLDCYDLMRREVKAIHRDSLSGEMRFQTLFKNADSWAFDVIPYGDKFVANGCFNDLQFGLFSKDGELLEAVGSSLARRRRKRK